jgi:uncharacterized protein (TIGR00251 family)
VYFVSLKNGSLGVRILAQPKAKKSRIIGLHNGMVKIALAAPPVDGKANKHLINFLAAFFGIKQAEITLVSGTNTRKKVCVIGDLSRSELETKLKPYLGTSAELRE